ncbi:bifunctional riboflavin kinase/FAD synthetase [Bacillus timonensis]|nr:bifunctional riboflavin kinase/FAD synthetase [Bacillus timonensis]
MKIIRISHPHTFIKNELAYTVLAIGYFDGVHKGHQKVINTAKQYAIEKGYLSAVMSFDPHPSVVLGRDTQEVQYITPLKDKAEIISKLGIDVLYVVEFNHEFANLLPQQFVDSYIIDLNVKHVVAGFDFTYGRLGKGKMETMPFHSRGEFTSTTVEKLTQNEQKISSTLIRGLIRSGDVDQLTNLLGRFYSVSGVVVNGENRGSKIGFPTANIRVNDEYILPPTGVYTVRIKVRSKWYNGVCNIGYKPTFHENQNETSVEVHIFEFNDSIYGELVEVEWHQRIRAEKKFASIEQLVSQITKDKEFALAYFENINEETCFLS